MADTIPTHIYVLVGSSSYGQAPQVQCAYTEVAAANDASFGGVWAVQCIPIHYHAGVATAMATDSADVNTETKTQTKTPKKTKDAAEAKPPRVSKKTTIPEGNSQSLEGHTFALAGTLGRLDHKTFKATVEKYGGSFIEKLATADYAVLGTNPGTKRTEEITDQNVHTINEEKFFELIGADFEPVVKKAKK